MGASKLTLAITRLRGFVSHLLNFVVMWFGLRIGGWWYNLPHDLLLGYP